MGGVYLKQTWLFIFAPLCGAALSVVLYKTFNFKYKKEEKTEIAKELVDLNNNIA